MWLKHRENCQIVVHSRAFDGLKDSDPLSITSRGPSGVCQPFDASKAAVSLASTGKYLSSVNVAWLDWQFTPLGTVFIVDSNTLFPSFQRQGGG